MAKKKTKTIKEGAEPTELLLTAYTKPAPCHPSPKKENQLEKTEKGDKKGRGRARKLEDIASS